MARFFLLLAVALGIAQARGATPARTMQLGVDADNWHGQVANPNFEKGLEQLGIDFISWHISPEEENHPARLDAIVKLCRRHHWSYLFNTELGNFVRDYPGFAHADGTYRYDLAAATLAKLKDDPLFLGVVYDEADIVQGMLGVTHDGKVVPPYFVDTRRMTAAAAFLAVAAKVKELDAMYARYGKRLIFEMTFPDYPFAFARGGALLAPKLLKEAANDLMYAVYRGAALEYHSSELWACIDLWYLDKFPDNGTYKPGGHTPDELLKSLEFAYSSGFDYVYIENVGGLLTGKFVLSPYGEKLGEFARWRATHTYEDWRTAPVELYVKRFPDGYWGQDYSSFLPDHPYGSWQENPHREADARWFEKLHELSHGVLPDNADSWNATSDPKLKGVPYRATVGLPAMVVFDQYGVVPPDTKAKVLDLTSAAR